MCIIIAKPAGVDLPDTETLDNCFTSNRDGIGFAFNKTGETPHIAKGYANVKKLEKMIDEFKITKEHNLLIHFRLATHGAKDQGNCHPFPLTSDYKEMRYLNCICDVAVAHNGVFGSVPSHEKHSDTMKFIGGILAQPEIINNIESPAVKSLIKGYCGYSSKLAFLRSSGITTIGDFEEDKGIKYSNTQFKSRVTTYNNWDKDDRGGKSWCYIHKEKDYCQWCQTHKVWDLCEYNLKENNCCSKKPLLLVDSKGDQIILNLNAGDKDNEKKCTWCQATEGIKYDYAVQSELCEECAELWSNGDSFLSAGRD